MRAARAVPRILRPNRRCAQGMQSIAPGLTRSGLRAGPRRWPASAWLPLPGGGPGGCVPRARSILRLPRARLDWRLTHVPRAAAMSAPAPSIAVVLLSGGLDSATALAMARAEGLRCHALSVDYGQRHRAELTAAGAVARQLGAAAHTIVPLDLRPIGGSALTDSAIAVPETPTDGIPITYVPARNTLLLALALGLAETIGASQIVIGVNALDYSGYPDCRPAFIAKFQELAAVATKAGIEGNAPRIHAPLIDLTKAEIIRRGTELGVDYALTVSCYQADDQGRACGRCDSCRLRAEGFRAAGLPDPTRYA